MAGLIIFPIPILASFKLLCEVMPQRRIPNTIWVTVVYQVYAPYYFYNSKMAYIASIHNCQPNCHNLNKVFLNKKRVFYLV